MLKQMVRNASTSIVFLDACRDNPLAASLAKASRSLDVGRGLARVEAPASMMIVYSAESGKVALDGTGRNSPFTSALLSHIDEEGTSISDVMIEVRNDVLKETGGKQRPFESASLTGKFFFKPASQQAASSTDTEIAALREQIAKLQSDQGALLKSQQEQLELLQKKLAEQTKSLEAAPAQTSASNFGTLSRVIEVEPSGSGNSALEQASASVPPASAAPQEESTKVAAVEGKSSEATVPEAAKPTEAPLPQGAERRELARDMLVELKRLGCYSGGINGNWSARSLLALGRFNKLASLDLPLDDPQQESLDALKGWKGPRCPVEQAGPPRLKQRPVVVAPPRQGAAPRKSVRVAPPREPSIQAGPPPQHQPHVSDEQRELQRAFPSTSWPGQ